MAVDSLDGDSKAAYNALLDHYSDIIHLDRADDVLFWDQQVMMPEDGTPARSGQRSTLSSLRHQLITDDTLGTYLDELDGADLDEAKQTVVREIKREYERETRVSSDLMKRLSKAISDATPIWRQAREESDFESFVPALKEIVEIRQEQAEQIDPDKEPFAVIFEEYEPYLTVDTVESMLHTLRDELVPLIEAIRESDADPGADVFTDHFDSETQFTLSEEALELVGVDWGKTRLDLSTHPFSFGNRYDVRMTTRFDEENPIDGLTSTLHEFGHTDYTQGLSKEHYGSPLGEPRSHGIHESQSRFWENQIGRSSAFWEQFLPVMQEHFPQTENLTVDEAFAGANQVYENNFIRVEADELTYHMHILLRFEIERDLINGDLAVEDVPEAWNDKMDEYLGIRPPNDAQGCLQDIHWSLGRIGTFQNYSVGSVFAAQIEAAMEAELGSLDEYITEGDFEPIHQWLNENVHEYGQRYRTDELIEVATGESLTASYFVDAMKEKYGTLYGVN